MKFADVMSKFPGRAPRGMFLPLAVVGGAFALYNSFFNVESGHRALKFNIFTGLSPSVYEEGTHLLIPFIERPTFYNVRTQAAQIPAATGSKDLQTINITCRVLTRPDPRHLVKIHRVIGPHYADRVIPSIGNETLKAVIAKFNAAELLTRRADVTAQICAQLKARALDFGIMVDDVAITQLSFSKEYRDAVEAKQIAEQEAGRAKFRVEQAAQEKRSVEVLAAGEAEAAKLVGDAVRSNPGFLQLRRLDAARVIAATVAKSKNRLVLDSSALMLDVGMGATTA